MSLYNDRNSDLELAEQFTQKCFKSKKHQKRERNFQILAPNGTRALFAENQAPSWRSVRAVAMLPSNLGTYLLRNFRQ